MQHVHINKKYIVATFLLTTVGILVFMFFGEIRGYVIAPRFSELRYSHTTWGAPPIIALPPEGGLGYIPSFMYRAEGSEGDIAQTVINELEKKGYTYRGEAQCWGRAGDRYHFTHPRGNITVEFFSDSVPANVNTTDVGCQRPPTSYSVEVVDFRYYTTGEAVYE